MSRRWAVLPCVGRHCGHGSEGLQCLSELLLFFLQSVADNLLCMSEMDASLLDTLLVVRSTTPSRLACASWYSCSRLWSCVRSDLTEATICTVSSCLLRSSICTLESCSFSAATSTASVSLTFLRLDLETAI